MMELDLIYTAFSGLGLVPRRAQIPEQRIELVLERDWQKRLPVFPWGGRTRL